MATSDEVNAAPTSPEAAEPADKPATVRCVRESLSGSHAPARQLDHLVDELQAAVAGAIHGAALTALSVSPGSNSFSTSASGDEQTASQVHPEASRDLLLISLEPKTERPGRSQELTCSDNNGADGSHHSTELVNCAEGIDGRETLFARIRVVARRPIGWDGIRVRPVMMPVAMLIAFGGLGAVTLGASDNLSKPVVGNEAGRIDLSAFGAEKRKPIEQRWSAFEERVEIERHSRRVQEPITPKAVKTVRIYEKAGRSTAAPEPVELSPLGQMDAVTPEQRHRAQMVESAGQPALGTATEQSSAEWTSSATRNASLTERVEMADSEAAPVDRALGSAPETSATPDDPGGGSAQPSRSVPVTSHANMRSGPDSDSEVITVIPDGARVGVINCATWCEIVFEDKRGWVHKSLLTGASVDGRENSAAAGPQMIVAGMPLISADGAQIGVIRGLTKEASGELFVVVGVAEGLGTTVPVIRLRTEHVVAASQKARLNVTRANFVKSLQP